MGKGLLPQRGSQLVFCTVGATGRDQPTWSEYKCEQPTPGGGAEEPSGSDKDPGRRPRDTFRAGSSALEEVTGTQSLNLGGLPLPEPKTRFSHLSHQAGVDRPRGPPGLVCARYSPSLQGCIRGVSLTLVYT